MSLSKISSSITAKRGNIDEWVSDVDKDLNNVFQTLRGVPNITTGTAVPTTTPSRIGNIYVDTNNSKVYIAKGTDSSADWLVLN